ncbi:PIG-L deacetylase family protein [Jatrophihabitans sp. DSM 45814]
MTYTLVSFHAHPDDEALLTAGTLARAAAEGHRVVLVVATSGEAGLAAAAQSGLDDQGAERLGALRIAELERSAAILGCDRLVRLEYPDSGLAGERGGFAALDIEEPAQRLADILTEERADVLTVYDARGGYGHPDHIQVHRVGHRAAELAGTAVVLEATVNQKALVRVARALQWTRLMPPDFTADRMRNVYSDPRDITHRVDVRHYLAQKRASMQAHATQAGGGESQRTLAFCVRLPGPLFRLAFGREWFVQRGRTPTDPRSSDIFDSLRPSESLGES